jgi:hypothetical protein
VFHAVTVACQVLRTESLFSFSAASSGAAEVQGHYVTASGSMNKVEFTATGGAYCTLFVPHSGLLAGFHRLPKLRWFLIWRSSAIREPHSVEHTSV